MSVHLLAHPHGKTWLPLDDFFVIVAVLVLFENVSRKFRSD
jgi:hypothetical protein